ncbi:beta-carotene 15,15'-monooxygenase, Brp/Blh family [Candidatus Planktophila versatilis]|uniref:Brp/Blh family beta-carotene 15,15'-dioxygenase n=1 Tax=Candidatus Planktophila versatilis TaxID=1884905 RepID=UPI000BAC9902|nr:Brp/Blh family beta-carotene 15,15'-dioxygenase [Candidatus Planktophila versatilis]ASY19244.1 beta-carotene 15,15'-monooxygenase, Brp/Blh family [Candidatus Planktophila versatilis]
MSETKLRLFNRVRTFSSAAVAIATVLSLLFSQWLGTNSLGWQLVVATIALAIGIPHGALDHLVTLPKAAPIRMALFIILYVAIALLAIYAILRWNVWGFIFVVIMSATHFGIGDAAFLSEKVSLDGSSRIPAWFYAPAAGLLPVAIPLVNSRSTDALEKVNPALINWHSGFTTEILMAVAVVTTLCLLALLQRKRYRDALDILLLAALASFAPPLVAFAVYFGCWHAMRHTARLTSLLPNSESAYLRGRPGQAFAAAVIPGLPALVGTLIFVVILAGFSQQDLSDKFLWLTLVTIWALTVPHMIVTARLDRAALKK